MRLSTPYLVDFVNVATRRENSGVDDPFEVNAEATKVVGMLVRVRINKVHHWIGIKKCGGRYVYLDSLQTAPREISEETVGELVSGENAFQIFAPY